MKKKELKTMSKTLVFIDASNIIYSASRNGWRVDFEKLAKYLKERFGASRLIQKKMVKLISCSNTTARDLKKLFGPRFTDLNLLKSILGIKMRQTLLKNLPLGVMLNSRSKMVKSQEKNE